jgi:hypothetical protein
MQLRGDLSEKIRSLREEILYEIAFIESALDDRSILAWMDIRRD